MLNIVEKYSADTVVESEEGVIGIEYVLLASLAAVVIAGLAGPLGGLSGKLQTIINKIVGQPLASGGKDRPSPRDPGLAMRRSHPSRRGDDGVVALEFVLLLPFLLMLLIGSIVLGNYLSVKGQASNLARDGARQAALFPGTPFSDARRRSSVRLSDDPRPEQDGNGAGRRCRSNCNPSHSSPRCYRAPLDKR